MNFIIETVNNNISELARFKQNVSDDYLEKAVKLVRIEMLTMEQGFNPIYNELKKSEQELLPDLMFKQVIKDFEPYLDSVKKSLDKKTMDEKEIVLGIKMHYFQKNLDSNNMGAIEMGVLSCRSSLRLLEVYLATFGTTHDGKKTMASIDPLLAQVDIEPSDVKSLFTFFHQLASRILDNEKK